MIKLKTKKIVMSEIYDRIIDNKPFDTKLKPYDKKIIEELLSYYEELEEYEKCNKIHLFMKDRYNHSQNFQIKIS